jgi:DNA topoisomerase-1
VRGPSQAAAAAAVEGLSHADDREPGIGRKATAAGFVYVGPDGRRIRDPLTLERIRRLAVPPAWTEVWICPEPHGHIQAVGRDARGRKQYRYHETWRQVRDGDKFDRLVAFGRALPRLRRRVEADLARPGLPREKVLAAVVRVLETTLIRVGNDEYAAANGSFGVTTLRDRHVRIGSHRAVFEFRGKAGKTHRTGFNDRRLARIVKACQDLPGQRLFQYLDDDGKRRAVQSADVNAYIRDAMGEDFSAKDFRTWAGAVAAAQALCLMGPAAHAAEAKRNISTCVGAVARLLGNTAAVARRAYIHPAILDAYAEGGLALKTSADRRTFELQVLRFLQAQPATVRQARRGGRKAPGRGERRRRAA